MSDYQSPPAKIGIIANPRKPKAEQAVGRFIDLLRQRGIQTFLEKRLSNLSGEISEKADGTYSREKLLEESELMVVFGGDGTILSAAQTVGSSGLPILGINVGSLGFLTQLNISEMEDGLQKVCEGKYRLQKRMVLETSYRNQKLFALNEVVIDKGDSPRIIKIELSTEEELLNYYNSDGLIISTPTGSTAHSLSAGGPILHPQMDAFVITPICPHSLSVKPLVLSGETVLKAELKLGSEAALIIDGQRRKKLNLNEEVIVKKAPYTLNLIDFKEKSFYNVLRKRLKWGT